MEHDNCDEYYDIYRIDMEDEWMNSAYDELGDAVVCDLCESELKWDANSRIWKCPECGQELDRHTYFNYIGASPPGIDCLTNCQENYPFCKKFCDHYTIDQDDPMVT